MTPHTITLLLTIILTTFAQEELQCEIPGVCVDNIDVGDTSVPSYNECLSFCTSYPGCLYFTYYPDISACVAFSQCGSISDETCPDCLTSEVGCPVHPLPQCDVPGWCEGNLLDLSRQPSSRACLRRCGELAEMGVPCAWYNYNTGDLLCAANENCLLYDPLRPNSVTGELECLDTPGEFIYLMVIGGDTSGGTTDDVEIVDLDMVSPLPCMFKPANFPYEVEGATSAFIEGYAHLCGGSSGGGGGQTEAACYAYLPERDLWEHHGDLLVARQRAAGVMFNDFQWWISGGLAENGGNNYLEETELYTDGFGTVGYIPLPEARERHTMLRIDDTHFFLSGGRGQQQDGSRTWIFNSATEEWTEQEPSAENRDGEFAGIVIRQDGTREVVVAGGIGLSSSEIFSLTDMTWRAGPDLPQELYEGASVQFGNTFLLVGGENGDSELTNVIYQYDEVNDEFVVLHQILVTPRKYHSAVLINSGSIDCKREE